MYDIWNEIYWHPVPKHYLAHCGLATPYGDINFGSPLAQIMACCLTKPSPEPNVNWSSKEFCDVPLKAISQELLMNLIHNICSKVILLKLLLHFPGANELSTGHQPSGPQMVAKVIHFINSYCCLWAVFSWEYDSLEQGCLTIWFDSLGQGCDFISLGCLTPFGADRGRPGVKCLVKDTSNWL